ncbi:MAG: UDP-N-acetylmuramoyl-tripeptide--D-alanyl-D-alanine ligase [Gammaproteobacteria bacterium]|nr:UDP-N-acetylmuramoyl-tripeptide--D-alanyl-D-alanine ligase [Gammaproteobacteria bacterium]TVQ47077.1 MAG: UDP-N-acetylmuramoyl-tripeptide--D-alanyl-D-alanine ligase [Gammaproteobacteria bacterium]
MTLHTLAEVALVTGGELIGPDSAFDGVSIDTRTLTRGNLFVALVGPRFNGHDFVEIARSAGAAGVLVGRAVDAPVPQVLVPDPLQALQRLAAHWRRGFAGPVIGLTGSNGKTTVKEMLRAILAERGPVMATRGNLNNEIGVPLTLLRLARRHRAAVVEMGANHAGEIARLTTLVQPTVGLVTNAGPAHLEGFGSLDGVAQAKGELFRELPEHATAVVNADDRYAPLWLEYCARRPVVRFGLEAEAEFTARDVRSAGDAVAPRLYFRLVCPLGEGDVQLPMAGEHNVRNALGAAAAAVAAGASLADVKTGLATCRNPAGRLQPLAGRGGAVVFDDSYNANPGSVRAAIATLAALPGRRWLVLGDMGELGEQAEALHAELGQAARAAGLDGLLCIGPLAAAAAAAFGAAGRVAADLDEAEALLVPEFAPGTTVLVKASRAAGLDRLVARLIAPDARTGS